MSPEDERDRLKVVTDLTNNMHGNIIKEVVHFMELMDVVRVKRSMVLACVIGILLLSAVEIWRTWFPDEKAPDTKQHLRRLLFSAIEKHMKDQEDANDGA